MTSNQQRNPLCKHGFAVCFKCSVITDDARRMADGISMLIVSHPWDTICNSWIAIALVDGTVENTLYETWDDAVRFHDTKRFAIFFMRNALGGTPARDCQLFLDMHRHAANSGAEWVRPAQSRIISTRSHDIMVGRVNPYAN